jgi:AraC-like DNA-binding protein
MNVASVPSWWPTRQLKRNPVNRVFVCGRRLHPPQYGHLVNFPRLELPLKGTYENQIEIDGQTAVVCLEPGSALFAAPNCWNLPTWRPGLELLSILFGKKQLGVSLISASGRQFTHVESKKMSIARPLTGPTPAILTALLELQADGGPADIFRDLIRALLRCVEELLAQPVAARASRAQVLLEDVRVYLQSHYQYEINRDSVAQYFSVTPNHLSRLFQTHGHMTFSSYLTHVRIDRAKHLLGNYNLKLDDISARCGYHDTPYFCHVFKNITRCTPMEYRLKANAAKAPKTPFAPPAT